MNIKISLVLLLIATSFFCNAQNKAAQIKYELYVLDSCKNKVSKLKFYVLIKNEKTFPSNEDGIVFLKEKGVYGLSTLYNEKVTKITFNTFENVVDTLAVETIQECYSGGTNIDFWGYCCCDEKCEGEQTSYYANGNIHIQGKFKEGIPIGKVKKYYLDGSLQQVDYYTKKGKFRKRKKYPPK